MKNTFFLIKIALILLFISSSYARDTEVDDDPFKESREKEKNMAKVWESKAKSFSKFKLKFDDGKLKVDKTGDVIIFVDNDYLNFNKSKFFEHIKFDTTLDKEKKVKCVFESKENDKLCDHDFFTANAADKYKMGGLLSFGKSLLKGKASVDRKFDKHIFAKAIMKNKDFLKELSPKLVSKIQQNKGSIDETASTEKMAIKKIDTQEVKEATKKGTTQSSSQNDIDKSVDTGTLASKKAEIQRLKDLKEKIALDEEIRKMKAEIARLKGEKTPEEKEVIEKQNNEKKQLAKKAEIKRVKKDNQQKAEIQRLINENRQTAQRLQQSAKKNQKRDDLIKVELDGMALEHVKNPSYTIQLAAVRENGLAIQFIKNPNDTLQVEALKENKEAVWYIDDLSYKAREYLER